MDDVLRGLGIPDTYGQNPRLPRFDQAERLVDVEPNIVGHMQQLTAATAKAWRGMKQAAAGEGIALLIVSGYRSIGHQAALIRRKLDAGSSLAEVLKVNAAPGFSQHHTGRAIDVATPGCPPLVEAFEQTAAYAWLTAHAGEYGFSLSYGRDNPFGFDFEPWHWARM